jgi:hypothetical protein
MTLKTMIVSGACFLCWIVLFPLAALGTVVGLIVLAMAADLSLLLTGTSGQGIDHSAAREMAMRICFGYRGTKAHTRFTRKSAALEPALGPAPGQERGDRIVPNGAHHNAG